jgi:hypothetical protein
MIKGDKEMQKLFARWFLVWFLAALILLCLGLGIRVAAAAERGGAGVETTTRTVPADVPAPDVVGVAD